MIIGNDIVDLGCPMNKVSFKRKRWVQKAFSAKEVEFIYSQDDPYKACWLFWSCKEAVYKSALKTGLKPFMDPKRISVDVENIKINKDLMGTAEIEGKNFSWYSISAKEWVHTICDDGELKNTIYATFELNTNEKNHGKELKDKVVAILKKTEGFAFQNIFIDKTKKGIPYVYGLSEGRIQLFDLSLSHDGGFGAFCMGSLGHSQASILEKELNQRSYNQVRSHPQPFLH
ncbi:MAG: 4'-phosphopantetheinyl transferase superfamily protein [Bacteroidota bacterium]